MLQAHNAGMATVYIALGSNLGPREQHLEQAFIALAELAAPAASLRRSGVYETDPVGPGPQPASTPLPS